MTERGFIEGFPGRYVQTEGYHQARADGCPYGEDISGACRLRSGGGIELRIRENHVERGTNIYIAYTQDVVNSVICVMRLYFVYNC
jgi:hypothetical protein